MSIHPVRSRHWQAVVRTTADTWTMLEVPAQDQVTAVAWRAGEQWRDPTQVVLCFSPRSAGVVLTPVAEYLRFSPLSAPIVARPAAVKVTLDAECFELSAFGWPLWRAEPLAAGDEGRPEQVLVLVVDRPRVAGRGGVLDLRPEAVWAARLPLGS